MNRIKLLTITIAALFVSIGATSICGAGTINKGEIRVEVYELLGLVNPTIDINESVSVNFLVNVTEQNNKTINHVTDKLVIPINLKDSLGRSLVFSRSLAYTIVITRDFRDVIGRRILRKNAYPGADSFFKRLCPVVATGIVPIIDSSLGKDGVNSLNISLNYHIANETRINGEKLTMHIAVMGVLPGRHEVSIPEIPRDTFYHYMKISLDVSYSNL